ncbi:MAG: hypothetical protein MJZ05_11065 [Fibrobacter sp.]|nr:hypothetical protein [Fibrobacter sp.]
MKTRIIFALILAAISFSFGQNDDSSAKGDVSYDEGFFTDDYFIGGSPATWDDVKDVISSNDDAADKAGTATILGYTAYAFAVTGGAFMGYALGYGLFAKGEGIFDNGRDVMFCIGLGAAAVGYLIEYFANGKRRSAIDTYKSEGGFGVVSTPQGGVGFGYSF